jgi:uroporphyrin-III C-methyltransferase / precorrin-2 dehydrogenase / sirohydrochlorin ferrochelatase
VLRADTAAIYMGAAEAEAIAAALIAAGKPSRTPIALVENVSLADMAVQYATLEELPRLVIRGGPMLILVGEVYGEALAHALKSAPSLLAGAVGSYRRRDIHSP